MVFFFIPTRHSTTYYQAYTTFFALMTKMKPILCKQGERHIGSPRMASSLFRGNADAISTASKQKTPLLKTKEIRRWHRIADLVETVVLRKYRLEIFLVSPSVRKCPRIFLSRFLTNNVLFYSTL